MATAVEQCESCEELRRENESLREQLAAYTGAEVGLPGGAWWWAKFAGGWLLLSVVPSSLVTFLSLDADSWVGFTNYGIAYATAWTQWSILTCIVVLLAKPIWLRGLLYVAASAGVATWWTFILNALDDTELDAMVYVAPIAGCLVAIPSIACRMMWRWRIMHIYDKREPAPTSIATFIVLTAVVAVVVASLSWLPEEVRDSWTMEEYVFPLIFLSPLVGIATFAVAALWLLLRHRTTPWLYAVFGCGLTLVVTANLAGVGPYIYSINDGTPDVGYVFFGGTFAVTFAFWFVFSLFWLRWLGYRLRP